MLQWFHHWWIPVLSAIIWWGMLIALLSIWSAEGHPVYKWMEPTKETILFLSDIAAQSWHIQPIFIVCSAAQGLLFVLSLASERYLRDKRRLRPNLERADRALSITSIVCAAVGQLGILIVSVCNTHYYHTVHESLLVLFIAANGVACVFTMAEYGMLVEALRNKQRFVVTFCVKLAWFIIMLGLTIAFMATHFEGKHVADEYKYQNACAVVEWCLCFTYPFYTLSLAYDLWPAHDKDDGHYPPFSADNGEEGEEGEEGLLTQ